MTSNLPDLYPNLLDELYDSGKYKLEFSDITQYNKTLDSNIYHTTSTITDEDRSHSINKDTHRHGFEENCHLNISTKKPKNIKLTYPVDATHQNTITLDKLDFEDDDLLGQGEDDEKTQFLKHQILIILHILYNRRLESLITDCYRMKMRDLEEEIVSVLRNNGIHFKFFKKYRKKKHIQEIRKLLMNIHLTTLIYDQNMFGTFMAQILHLHAHLVNIKPEENFMTGIFQIRTPEMQFAKLNFNISSTGEIISVDFQIKNTFLFIANSSNISSGGAPISNLEDLGIKVQNLKDMDFDTVQYKLESNFEVSLTPKKSPVQLKFELESFLPQGFKVPIPSFQCSLEKFRISQVWEKTEKRKGKKTKKKKKKKTKKKKGSAGNN